MSTNQILDFTVTELLGGGDDVQRLVVTDDPDGLWDQVVQWPRHRLTAALAAAVGIIQSEEPAGGRGHRSSAIDRHTEGRDIERTPPDGH